jgi:hypothetical protein
MRTTRPGNSNVVRRVPLPCAVVIAPSETKAEPLGVDAGLPGGRNTFVSKRLAFFRPGTSRSGKDQANNQGRCSVEEKLTKRDADRRHDIATVSSNSTVNTVGSFLNCTASSQPSEPFVSRKARSATIQNAHSNSSARPADSPVARREHAEQQEKLVAAVHRGVEICHRLWSPRETCVRNHNLELANGAHFTGDATVPSVAAHQASAVLVMNSTPAVLYSSSASFSQAPRMKVDTSIDPSSAHRMLSTFSPWYTSSPYGKSGFVCCRSIACR